VAESDVASIRVLEKCVRQVDEHAGDDGIEELLLNPWVGRSTIGVHFLFNLDPYRKGGAPPSGLL
jgi:hypothetical protein